MGYRLLYLSRLGHVVNTSDWLSVTHASPSRLTIVPPALPLYTLSRGPARCTGTLAGAQVDLRRVSKRRASGSLIGQTRSPRSSTCNTYNTYITCIRTSFELDDVQIYTACCNISTSYVFLHTFVCDAENTKNGYCVLYIWCTIVSFRVSMEGASCMKTRL